MLILATVGGHYAHPASGDGSGSGEGGTGGGGDGAAGAVVIEHRAAGVVCVLAIYGFVSAFAYSWGPVVWTLCVEIFPTRQRARGVALTTTTNWLWNIAVGQCFPPLQQTLGFRLFFGFGLVSLLLLGWALSCVPETRGLSIDQVEQLFQSAAATTAGLHQKGTGGRTRIHDVRRPLLLK